MCVVNEEDKPGSAMGIVVPVFRARALVALLGLTMSGMAASGASAESRTISMYHIHTKERITITYWKDGRFIPSALRKLNWFLRDWRRNKAVRMDPRTIDLIWKLHADLGSKKPVYIICGHRSAATNAMLRRIGRRVARRSRHITGQAIDFKFPDVPNWKVRNLALAYGIGGVGYYGDGPNGFIHADTGSVRHWPRISQRRLASIIRKYRRYIGRGYKRGNDYVMIAKANMRRANFNRKAAAVAKAGKTGESGQKANARHAPIPLPGVKPMLLAAATTKATIPMPRSRPYQVLVMAASRMEITPVSAPATITNFAKNDSVRDPIGVVIASLPKSDPEAEVAALQKALAAEAATEDSLANARGATQSWPRVVREGKGDLAVALANGQVAGVPTLETMALRGPKVARNGKESPLNVEKLGMTPQQLARRDGAPLLDNASTQRAGMFWPGMRVRAVPDRGNHPQRVNRAEKGDLLATARLPENIRKAALEEGALQAGDLRPISFR